MTSKTTSPAAPKAENSTTIHKDLAASTAVSEVAVAILPNARTPIAPAMSDVPAGNKVTVSNASAIPLEYTI